MVKMLCLIAFSGACAVPPHFNTSRNREHTEKEREIGTIIFTIFTRSIKPPVVIGLSGGEDGGEDG